MTGHIGRREFITLLGGAAAWPLAARAQQPAKLPIVGFLVGASRSATSQWIGAFVQRLRELGWTEGRTVTMEFRWADGQNERAAEIAAEFVRLKVDVMVAGGTPSVVAAKHATSIIPIVFAAAGDPVASNLVASLAQPGGNVTGLSLQQTDLAAKRLELLRELQFGPAGDHGQCRQSWRYAGDGRGKGNGPYAWLGGRHIRNPTTGRYRGRLRDTQGPR